jgi:hypothetical protein
MQPQAFRSAADQQAFRPAVDQVHANLQKKQRIEQGEGGNKHRLGLPASLGKQKKSQE